MTGLKAKKGAQCLLCVFFFFNDRFLDRRLAQTPTDMSCCSKQGTILVNGFSLFLIHEPS